VAGVPYDDSEDFCPLPFIDLVFPTDAGSVASEFCNYPATGASVGAVIQFLTGTFLSKSFLCYRLSATITNGFTYRCVQNPNETSFFLLCDLDLSPANHPPISLAMANSNPLALAQLVIQNCTFAA
jgi:hypothetical protein